LDENKQLLTADFNDWPSEELWEFSCLMRAQQMRQDRPDEEGTYKYLKSHLMRASMPCNNIQGNWYVLWGACLQKCGFLTEARGIFLAAKDLTLAPFSKLVLLSHALLLLLQILPSADDDPLRLWIQTEYLVIPDL
jgi:hypothetical protein